MCSTVDVIFENVPAQSKEELEKQKTRAFKDIRLTIPVLVHKVLGEGLKDGLAQILEVFQNPVCNKQVKQFIIYFKSKHFDHFDMNNK